MKKFNCPSCGAEVVFQSNVSVYAVCAFCSSMIVRHDIDVESIGTMAVLPDDMSPLMIDTEGKYQDVNFHIIGRLKIGWKDGNWNEWYMVTDNGGRGWIAEAQGLYAICFEYEEALPTETVKTLNKFLKMGNPLNEAVALNETAENTMHKEMLGTYLFINRLKYKIVDVKSAVCIGSEGELPFIAPNGRKTLAIDLLGIHGEFASIEFAKEKTRVYLGQYLEWNALQFQNLRPLEGW